MYLATICVHVGWDPKDESQWWKEQEKVRGA